MKNTTQHISALLYTHNCVIVPNFGGFVANYAAATIHPVQHLFTPPSKNIAFNKNLITNDGLLANRIASTDNISYSQAVEQINAFVEQLNAELITGNKILITDVGTLFLDVERNIQFKPSNTNFALASFGLAEFQSPAIKQDYMAQRIEKSIKKEMQSRGPIEAPKRKLNYKRVAALAVSLPLIAGALWMSLTSDTLQNINYASLSPFSASRPVDTMVIYTYTDSVVKVTNYNENVAETTPAPVTETVLEEEVVAEVVEVTPAPTLVVKPAPTPIKVAKVEAPKNTRSDKKLFHLVIGCFKDEKNAEQFVANLKATNNIEASIAGKNDNGLYVISGGDYSSKDEAKNGLAKLKEVQPGAWLMTHSF
jgi:septal ring-binding cell division protein DamX